MQEMNRSQKLLDALDQLSRHINRQIYRQNHRRMAMGHGQGRLLRLLAQEGSMTQAALSERAQLRPPTVAELLEKLENAGMIARARDTEDRRRVIVSVTERGRGEIESMHDSGAQFAEDLFSGLTENEIETMLALVEKLNAQFRNEEEPGEPPLPPFGGGPREGFPPPPPPFGERCPHGRPGFGPEENFRHPGPFREGHGPLGHRPRPPFPPENDSE